MHGVAAVFGKIALAIGVVFLAMGAASAVSERPVKATTLDTASNPVWTSVPVRVDPSRQQYERIESRMETDQYPIKFRAGTKYTIIDGATFETDGARFNLAGLDPLPRKAICQDGARRTACGTRAFIALTKALNGKFIDCRSLAGSAVECRSNGRDLAQLVSASLK